MSSGKAEPVDSKSFLYIPTWVKIVAISVLFFIMIISAIFVAAFIGNAERETWILVGMSTAQTAGSALILFLVVAFSQRDATVKGVQLQSDNFLTKLVPDALRRAKVGAPDFQETAGKRRFWRALAQDRPLQETFVQIAHDPGGLGASYIVKGKAKSIRMFIEMNVWKVVVVYYIPARDENEASELRRKLEFSFPEDGDDGFNIFSNFSKESFDGRWYLNMVMVKVMADDFPENNLQKVFLANMIMTHTVGILRNAERDALPLSYEEFSRIDNME